MARTSGVEVRAADPLRQPDGHVAQESLRQPAHPAVRGDGASIIRVWTFKDESGDVVASRSRADGAGCAQADAEHRQRLGFARALGADLVDHLVDVVPFEV